MQTGEPDDRGELDGVVDDLKLSAGFLTRVPVAWLGMLPERPDFRRAVRVFPLIGAFIGIGGGIVLVVAARLGVPPLVAAALAIATVMIITGGLHEDGLADTVDGFGGGATASRKLEIMDDSRIGTYGAAALVFSILIRVGALASLIPFGPIRAALALVAAEAVARAAMVRFWQVLPAARLGGLAYETGPPDQPAMVVAVLVALAIALVLVWPAIGFWSAVAGILLAVAATYIFTRISDREIGGRTGDTLGACQQVAVAAFLVGVAA
jgi:adenosylcobinamide-GDP ribazoletransferase